MSLTVVLSVKQPRSDCSQTVKTYGTKTTELSQWTVIKASLKTLIGFYKITPPCILCMLVSVLVFQIWWNVCVHVSQSTIPFVFVHFCVFSCVHVFSTFRNNLFSATLSVLLSTHHQSSPHFTCFPTDWQFTPNYSSFYTLIPIIKQYLCLPVAVVLYVEFLKGLKVFTTQINPFSKLTFVCLIIQSHAVEVRVIELWT